MPYITKGNVSKIISSIEKKDLPKDFVYKKGNIYKRTISFFSPAEQDKLLLRKEFCRKPSSFIEVYQKILKKKDTFTYIYEGGSPAYHLTNDCPRLTSKFDSYEIPFEIQDEGEDSVIRFRKFFGQNKELLESNATAFYVKMSAAFGIQTQLKPVGYKNSGAEFIELEDLSELERKIESLLLDFQNLYQASSVEKRYMINLFKTKTFLAYPPYNKNIILNNDTMFSDDEIREFLKFFSESYKIPLTRHLKNFYRVFFNPELEFEGDLLEVLGFKKCSHCYT
jgi:hypothetical protein